MKLFGYELQRQTRQLASVSTPSTDDGAVTIPAQPQYNDTFIDLEGISRSERELITRYREISLHPELQSAIDDILNEMLLIDPMEPLVKINLDKLALPDEMKDVIVAEFDTVLRLLDFNKNAYEILRRWYIDGRLYYQPVVDKTAPQDGIKEMRYLDPRKIKLIREVADGLDDQGRPIKVVSAEYFVYDDSIQTAGSSVSGIASSYMGQGKMLPPVRIAKDAIIFCTSGLVDEHGRVVLSHLHQAIKPLNQLRMLEDSTIIYRLARAPERRIFYVNVGNMPHQKAEQHLHNMMIRHKNRLVYNATDGTIRDDRKMMTMIEDYWFPRYGDNKSTEVQTLPPGQNLGEMEDIKYFRDRLFRSLNLPLSRMDPNTPYVLGRASEISRDEIKFQKFVTRLRKRFSILFNETLEKNLALKGFLGPEEWNQLTSFIEYDFCKDGFFMQLKQIGIMQEQADLLAKMNPFIGTFWSQHWIKKNVLGQFDQEIKQIDDENMIEAERDMQKQAILQKTMMQLGVVPEADPEAQ